MTDQDLRRQQAIDGLLTLIRKFGTESLLEEIADGDSYAMPGDTPKHLAALHDLRDHYDWRLAKQPDTSWYPREPIGLISYAVDNHSTSAQIFCNALLLVAELDGSDQDDMHFRWFKSPGEAWFRALANPWKDAFLAGFAVLHAQTSDLEKGFWMTPDAQGKWIEPKDDTDG